MSEEKKDTGKDTGTKEVDQKDLQFMREALSSLMVKYQEAGGIVQAYEPPEKDYGVILILKDTIFCPGHPPEKAVLAPLGSKCSACLIADEANEDSKTKSEKE